MKSGICIFWIHVLSMQDSDALFGEYLHHYPYFGMLSQENQEQWEDVQAHSEQLWQKLFNETLYRTDSVAQKCPQACPCHVDQVKHWRNYFSTN